MAKDTNLYMFLTGLGVGAAAAILLAPAAGEETRAKVLSAASGAGDRIKEGLARGSDMLDTVQTKFNDTVGTVQDKFNDTVNAATNASKQAADVSQRAVDEVVGQSKDVAHSAGRNLETAGQRLQEV